MYLVEKDGKKYLYDPITSDIAKIIGANNVHLCYEEVREGTEEDMECFINCLKRDSKPVFFPVKL